MHTPFFRSSMPRGVTEGASPEAPGEQSRHMDPSSVGVNIHSSPLTSEAPPCDNVKRQLSVIREELGVLRERRQALEEQRNRLLASTLPPRYTSVRQHTTHESAPEGQDVPKSARSFMQPTTTSELHHIDRADPLVSTRTQHTSRTSSRNRGGSEATPLRGDSALVNCRLIESEARRRRQLRSNPYSEMKSRLREECAHDSMCRMGTFLLEDSARVFTFGRERRFRPLPGEKQEYFLGAEKQVKQELNRRGQRRSQSAASRLCLLDETPGPGAYTPLYAKQSRPSVLTSLYY